MTFVINTLGMTPTGKLSPSEFEVMGAVWDAGSEQTITDIMNAVNVSRSTALKRATVQVHIRRLEDKGWLTHREEGRKFFYRATADRSVASADLARDLTDRVFDGSCAQLVRCLFERDQISAREIDRLRELVDEATKTKQRQR